MFAIIKSNLILVCSLVIIFSHSYVSAQETQENGKYFYKDWGINVYHDEIPFLVFFDNLPEKVQGKNNSFIGYASCVYDKKTNQAVTTNPIDSTNLSYYADGYIHFDQQATLSTDKILENFCAKSNPVVKAEDVNNVNLANGYARNFYAIYKNLSCPSYVQAKDLVGQNKNVYFVYSNNEKSPEFIYHVLAKTKGYSLNELSYEDAVREFAVKINQDPKQFLEETLSYVPVCIDLTKN